MTRRPAHLTLPCPAVFWGEYPCLNTIEVTAYPHVAPRMGRDPDDSDPGEAAHLEVSGCYHAETLTEVEEGVLWWALVKAEERARDAEINRRIDEALDK